MPHNVLGLPCLVDGSSGRSSGRSRYVESSLIRLVVWAGVLVLMGLATPGRAAIVTVNPSGIGGDYPTIQTAVDGVAPGDTIQLATGTFVGSGNRNIDFGGKALTLQSATGNAADVTLDCGFAGRAFYFHEGETNATIVENLTIIRGRVTGAGRGAGIACVLSSSPTLRGLAVRSCQADAKGGGVYCQDSSPVLESCLIAGNLAAEGAGLHCEGSADPSLIGCTLADNEATTAGGGIFSSVDDVLDLQRSIVFGNCASAGDEAYLASSLASLSFTCCNVDSFGLAGLGSFTFVADNLHEDPLFCGDEDCGTAPSLTGDYGLRGNSPCRPGNSPCGLQIGAADSTCLALPDGACCFEDGTCSILDSDLCGNALGSFQGAGTSCAPNPCPPAGACCADDGTCQFVTALACEVVSGVYINDGVPCDPLPCPPILVQPNGSGLYATIQDAIDAAGQGTIIELANGTFTGVGNRDLRFFGKSITLRSQAGHPDSVIIDVESAGRAFYFRDGESNATVVESLTVVNGLLIGAGRGAGIACVLGSSPTLRGLVVRGNAADANGGGIYCEDSSPVIEGCLVAGNTAFRGGGVCSEGTATPTLDRCTIAGNFATDVGGGLHAAGGFAVDVAQSIVWDNCAALEGDDVYVSGVGIGALIDCSIVDTLGIAGTGSVDLGLDALFADPLFCAPDPCTGAPSLAGSYSVASNSQALAAANGCLVDYGAAAPADTCTVIAIGSCCLDSGVCREVSATTCASDGGSYGGDGSSCDPSPCDIAGACCFSDGHCEVLIETACLSAGAAFEGEGIACDPQPCTPLQVEADGSGAYPTIQAAIDAAGPGAIVQLGNGTYSGLGNTNVVFRGKALILRSESGEADSCIVDCEASGRGLYFFEGETASTVVERISIVNGQLTGTGRGAGIACVGTSPTLRGLVIAGNAVENTGGGLYGLNASPALESCTITRNMAEGPGGGVHFDGASAPSFLQSIVFGNCAAGVGDEIYLAAASVSATLSCCDVDSSRVDGPGAIDYGVDGVFDPPVFCGPTVCSSAPHAGGSYRLSSFSPCLAANNACGVLIGALGEDCTGEPGACCFEDECAVILASSCVAAGGTYFGDGTSCDPNPCPEPGACCLSDGSCIVAIESTCEAQAGLFLNPGVACPPDGCNDNAGGGLLVHATPGLTWTPGADYCGTAVYDSCEGGVYSVTGDTLVFHVMAAFPDGSTPGLAGLTFGIDYDPTRFTMLDWGTCGDFELADGTWPAPGSGMAVTWTTAQTAQFTEVYWFAGVADSVDASSFTLTPHPVQGAYFVDNAAPPRLDSIACLGSLGFNMPGNFCCVTVSAEPIPGLTALPTRLALRAPYPNPFHERTSIVYDIPALMQARVSIYSADGRRVIDLVDEPHAPGTYRLRWNRKNAQGVRVPDGVYFIGVQTERGRDVQKLVLVR